MAFLKEKYGKEKQKTFEEISMTKQKGLLIREKYYNLPDDVADALLKQLKADYKFVEEHEDDDEEDQYRFDMILYLMRQADLNRCKKQVPKTTQPVKKLKIGDGQAAGEYLYYDDFDESVVKVVKVNQNAKNVVHIDVNIEPHNENDQVQIYNSRAVVWIKTQAFFDLI